MIKSFFVTCLLVFGQPDISLPDTARTDVGVFLPITATTKGEVVQFVALDQGLSIFPANLLADKKTTVVVASKAGRYRVLAYTSIENKPSLPAIITVVVGNPPDDSKPDNNKPDNNKPDNNKPDNNKPDDNVNSLDPEFVSSIKSIYGGLQEADKATSAKKLSVIYDIAATEADNVNHKVIGDFFAAYKSAMAKGMPANKLMAVKDSVSDFLDTQLGTDPSLLNQNFDAKTRSKFKSLFSQLSKLLGGLNG